MPLGAHAIITPLLLAGRDGSGCYRRAGANLVCPSEDDLIAGAKVPKNLSEVVRRDARLDIDPIGFAILNANHESPL